MMGGMRSPARGAGRSSRCRCSEVMRGSRLRTSEELRGGRLRRSEELRGGRLRRISRVVFMWVDGGAVMDVGGGAAGAGLLQVGVWGAV